MKSMSGWEPQVADPPVVFSLPCFPLGVQRILQHPSAAMTAAPVRSPPPSGPGVSELPRRCGHVRDRALHDPPDGQRGGGHPLPDPGSWRSALHVDQAQQPVPYPLVAASMFPSRLRQETLTRTSSVVATSKKNASVSLVFSFLYKIVQVRKTSRQTPRYSPLRCQ